MFNSNMVESSQDEIVMKEIDFFALKTVIDYFYTSQIKVQLFEYFLVDTSIILGFILFLCI